MIVFALLLLLVLLQVKHFVCDFVYQPRWMWANKGTFGHWGGIAHSGFHALATFLVFSGISFMLIPIPPGVAAFSGLLISAAEFGVHYAVDWTKMNINAHFGWGAATHNEFWVALGVDQFAHQLTYIAVLVASAIAWVAG